MHNFLSYCYFSSLFFQDLIIRWNTQSWNYNSWFFLNKTEFFLFLKSCKLPFGIKINIYFLVVFFYFDSQTKIYFEEIKTNSVKYSGEEQKEKDIKRTNERSKNPFDTTPQNLEKWFMVCENSPWVIKFSRFNF